MRLIGFNFTKISAERFEKPAKEVNVKTDLNITSLVKADIDSFKDKEELLMIKFNHNLNYEPDFAKINFEGSMIISVDPKIAKEALKEWKDKKVQKDVQIFVFNIILKKTTIKALTLEDELNLPVHMPLPRVSQKKD
jgi:hypothetical protein